MIKRNIMFLAMAVDHYGERFEENGAVSLNHMIQERSGFNREEAFSLVADVLECGMMRLDKKSQGKKCLVLNRVMFDEWKAKFVFDLPKIKASVVTPTWKLKRPDRKLTPIEREIVKKNIRKGRLFEVQKKIVDQAESDLEIPWNLI